MPNWKLFRASIEATRDGGTVGDAALLKLAALGRPRANIDEQLRSLRGYDPVVDLVELGRLPEGTFGRAYAEFMTRRGIKPFEFTERTLHKIGRDPYAIRYTVTHDMVHVLSGFDTGLAGEAGVLAFAVGQRTAPGGLAAMWFQRLLYPLVSPLQSRQMFVNSRVGKRMGEQSSLLLAERLEDHFHLPLVEVRRKFGIPDPKRAGVLPSTNSWVADSLYGWFEKQAPKRALPAARTKVPHDNGRKDADLGRTYSYVRPGRTLRVSPPRASRHPRRARN